MFFKDEGVGLDVLLLFEYIAEDVQTLLDLLRIALLLLVRTRVLTC